MMGVINRAWRAAVCGGGVAALLAGGCGQPSQPVATAPPPSETQAAKESPEAAVVMPTKPAPQPEKPAVEPVAPAPGGQSVPRPAFVPPTSPTFVPPPAAEKPAPDFPAIGPKPGDPPAATEPQKPTDPPKGTPDPKPADPPKAVDPPPPVPPDPKPADPPKDPKKVEYPDKINGKDLKWHLEESSPRYQKDPMLREAAIRTIPAFGPTAREPAVNPLIDAIRDDPDPGVKIAAITVVSNMGFDIDKHIKPAVNTLVFVLRNSSPGSALRVYCVRSLASFGTHALPAVQDLRDKSTPAAEPSWEMRLAIAETLGFIGAPAKKDGDPNEKAADTLLRFMLKDPCTAVKLEAVKSLLTLGPPKPLPGKDYPATVKPSLDLLEERIKAEGARGNDKGVYVWLLLLQIMYDGAFLNDNVKKVAKLIETPDGPNAPNLRLAALQVLSVLGPPAAPAVPQIIPALNYPEIELQMGAMVCLARIGTEARAAVAELEKIKSRPLETRPKDAPADWKAPPDWKPDDRLQKMAADTIDYIIGKKKIADAKPPEKKDEKK